MVAKLCLLDFARGVIMLGCAFLQRIVLISAICQTPLADERFLFSHKIPGEHLDVMALFRFAAWVVHPPFEVVSLLLVVFSEL